MYVQMCTHPHRLQVGLGCHPLSLLTFLRHNQLLNLELTSWLDWLASEARDDFPFLSSTEIKGMQLRFFFLMSAKDLNSGLILAHASPLPTEPYLLTPFDGFNMSMLFLRWLV